MHYCSKCKQQKPERDFNWKFKDVRLSYHCKECSRKYVKGHYLRNRLYYLAKARKRNLDIQERYNKIIGDYLSKHPCVDCSETDLLVLEFDHKERNEKLMEISRIMRRGMAEETLLNEISKCDVRCANCHRRKTAHESKSWRLNYMRLWPNG